MRREIEITDVWAESKEAMIREIKEHLEFLKEHNEAFPKDNDFIPEIADVVTPINTIEVKGTWFLHQDEVMQTVEPLGVPLHNLTENKGKMQAIALYLEYWGERWFDEHGRDYWEGLNDG